MNFDHTNPDNYINGKPGVCNCGKKDHEIFCTAYKGIIAVSDYRYRDAMWQVRTCASCGGKNGHLDHCSANVYYSVYNLPDSTTTTESMTPKEVKDKFDIDCKENGCVACRDTGCFKVKRWTDADMIEWFHYVTIRASGNEVYNMLDELKEFKDGK